MFRPFRIHCFIVCLFLKYCAIPIRPSILYGNQLVLNEFLYHFKRQVPAVYLCADKRHIAFFQNMKYGMHTKMAKLALSLFVKHLNHITCFGSFHPDTNVPAYGLASLGEKLLDFLVNLPEK